jgi:hypothetical protein
VSDPIVYECSNPACTLGVLGQPGRFSGGITVDQVSVRTGQPAEVIVEEKIPHGDGVCPNCGQPGKPENRKGG